MICCYPRTLDTTVKLCYHQLTVEKVMPRNLDDSDYVDSSYEYPVKRNPSNHAAHSPQAHSE